MTIEEITRILQTVAENQAKHDEMHSRHSADVAEIDAGIALLLSSQNRYEERQGRFEEILHDLADKQLKNEERFAELVTAQLRYELRQERVEATFEMFEEFVRNGREENEKRFAETDRRLALLAEAQAKTDEQMKRTDERINALIDVQAKTEERINDLFDRNGQKPPQDMAIAKTKLKARSKKAAKKGSAK